MSQCMLALKAAAEKSYVHRTSWCGGPKSGWWGTALVLTCLVWLWGGCAALGRCACQRWSSWWPGKNTTSQHMLGICSTGSVHIASGCPLLTFSPHSPCVHGHLWSPLGLVLVVGKRGTGRWRARPVYKWLWFGHLSTARRNSAFTTSAPKHQAKLMNTPLAVFMLAARCSQRQG